MQHLIAAYGYVAVFVLMVAEWACLLVPSELIMTFVGALAAAAAAGNYLGITSARDSSARLCSARLYTAVTCGIERIPWWWG